MLEKRATSGAPDASREGWRTVGAAVGLGVALAGLEAVRRAREADLRGQVALVTGASRGLGFLIARELGREGCRLAICARDEAGLERVRDDLASRGAEVFAAPCDVADQAQVEGLVTEVTLRLGPVEVLVNNAGVIQAGPAVAMEVADFEQALGVMFWGVVYPTLAVLPQMRSRRRGRIVNVTSIGSKVSVPHLLPYCSAKFAAVGFSEGLRAEMAREGIVVTTICPGLMRTGSHLNAWFKGDEVEEFASFAPLASLPLISMDAERAARQIVRAARRGEAERVLSLPAALLARVHGNAPGLTADLLGVVNRFLPSAAGPEPAEAAVRGMEVRPRLRSRLFEAATAFGRSAAERFNQYPGAPEAAA
jgi:short-subunit dehydrogenase